MICIFRLPFESSDLYISGTWVLKIEIALIFQRILSAFKVSMLGDSSYQTLFETSPPDSLYGKMWKTKFLDREK